MRQNTIAEWKYRRRTMPRFGTVALLLLGMTTWTGVLSGRHEASAQPAPTPVVVEVVRHVHADFSSGGIRKVRARWSACAERANVSRSGETAERCLVYACGVLLVAAPEGFRNRLPPAPRMSPEIDRPALFGMLDIMGVPVRLRTAYLSLYQRWVLERHIAEAHQDGSPAVPVDLADGRASPLSASPGPELRYPALREPVDGGSRPFGGAQIPRGFVGVNQPLPNSDARYRDPYSGDPYSGESVTHPVNAVPAPVAGYRAPRYQTSGGQSEIPLQMRGGDFEVPVVLNNAVTLKFQIDSGSSDVSVSRDVVAMLMRSGTLDRSDFLGEQSYTLADGSIVSNETFRIHLLRVGDREIRDVIGSVSTGDGTLLLGQSFLGRFKSWSIDNERRMLVLK